MTDKQLPVQRKIHAYFFIYNAFQVSINSLYMSSLITYTFLISILYLFHYFMLSGRISRNIGENIFRSYTGTTSEHTDVHVLVA